MDLIENKNKELLGWLIVKGAPMHVFNTVLGENLQFCRLSALVVSALPNEEFAIGRKKPYTELVLNYTNYREDNKRHQKEDLVAQNFDVDACMIWLLNKGFFAKWIFTYFRGFAKVIYDLQQRYPGEVQLSDASSLILDSFLETPALSEGFLEALTKPVENSKQKDGNGHKVTKIQLTSQELAEKIMEGNGVRKIIVAALKEDAWIGLGEYEELFGISKGAYLISEEQLDLLFEANYLVLQQTKKEQKVFSDLTFSLLDVCQRFDEQQQIRLLNLLIGVVCVIPPQIAKVRALVKVTKSINVKYLIKAEWPDMVITY